MRSHTKTWTAPFRGGKPRDLNTLLELGVTLQGKEAPEQLDWLGAVVRWLRGQRGFRFTPEARAHLLLQRLSQHQEWSKAAGVVITEVLARGSALRIYCEAGLPSNASVAKELMGRLVRSILPPVQREGSLAGALQQVFAETGDDVWLDRIPDTEREALIAWLRGVIPHERRTGLVREAAEAVWLLANRTTSISLRDEVAVRSPRVGTLTSHPMIQLEAEARAFAAAVTSGTAPNLVELLRYIELSRLFLDGVLAQIEEHGVSIDLVFQIERATSYVNRIEHLARTIATVMTAGETDAMKNQTVWNLLIELVRGELEDRRPGRVLAQSFHLIARKTVERAGETGEEGIARTNHDVQHVLRAAIGGGVFVAITALVKYLQPKGLPPFFEALYGALNYGGSFTLMHFLHLKLATKLPAVTASALAGRLTERATVDGDQEFASTAIAILRTQLAAVVGNILGVIPAALAIDWLVNALTGGHLLTPEKAGHVIESVSPWASLTIPFAMLTGVILWLGGWIASWIDNAYAFYNVDGALSSHGGLRLRFGEKRVTSVVDSISSHVGGVAAAMVLGFGLAFAPEIGRFFGFPLEVRHVTLVTAGLALSVAAEGLASITQHEWVATLAGVIVIAICNLGTAFGLAFAMALRARGLSAMRGVKLAGRAALTWLRRPLSLFHVAPDASVSSEH